MCKQATVVLPAALAPIPIHLNCMLVLVLLLLSAKRALLMCACKQRGIEYIARD